ncbi:MAG: hypothetical protein AAGJ10_15235 [Bacteroidota bacterium]
MSELGRFIADVRAGNVRQPNQRGFDLSEWRANYEAVEQPTMRDESLHASGILAHLVFSFVREKLTELGPLPMSSRNGARLMCAVVNRDVWQASEQLLRHLESRAKAEGFFNNQAVYDRFIEAEASQNKMDAGRAIEVSVDGGTHPLRSVIRGWLPGELTLEEGDDVGIIRASITMYMTGQLWSWLDLVWRKCVYGDLELALEGNRLIFQPIDDSVTRRRELSIHREKEMIAQLARQVRFELRQMPNLEQAIRGRNVLLKAGRRPPYRVRVGNLPATEKNEFGAAQWLQGRLMFQADYPDELLTTPLEAYDGLTAEMMLHAWEVLAPFVDQASAVFSHPDMIDTVEALFVFAPTVSEDSLLSGWTKTLGVTMQEARALRRAFTFRGEPRDTLWSRPLVRVGDGLFTFIVTTIKSPNVRWLLETWLRNSGLNLGVRGEWFEREVHNEVRNGLDGSPLTDVWISEGTVEIQGHSALPDNPDFEEIDLIVRIGRTVLVCEIKCSLVPMDDVIAEMNYRKVLDGGSVQAERKAQFLAANNEVAAAIVEAEGHYEPSELQYKPVLITNVSVGVGQVVKGVPVTDASLLRQYVQFGYHLRATKQDSDGGYEGGTRYVFYTDDAEAEKNIYEYLTNPPQLTVFEPLLRSTEMRMGEVAGLEVLQRYPVVEMPVDVQDSSQ